jgi:CcmD family protein
MTRARHALLAALLIIGVIAGAVDAVGAQSPPPATPQQQDEFVPIDQLPPQDQLPAAPLLVSAYVFVLLALFAYLFSVARRLNTVEREVERLEGDMKRSARS